MRAETGSSRPSVWDDRPRIDKAGQNRRSDGWKSDVYCQPRQAVKLKQMGVKAGVSDLCLPYPKGIYCGLYIEMKFGDNRQQVSQKEFLKDMAEAGHFVATCYSAEEAIEVIKKYLSLNSWRMNDVMIVMGRASGKQDAIEKMVMDIPNNSILKNGEIKESKPRKK